MNSKNATRRSFLLSVLRLLGIGFIGAWLYGIWRFISPRRISEPVTRFSIGFPDEYEPGTVSARWVRSPYKVWVIRDESGAIYVLYDECSHLSCALRWEKTLSRFKCPCHHSEFSMDGTVLRGPAARSLDRVRVKLEPNGEIKVDTSRRYRKERGEWEDPDSILRI